MWALKSRKFSRKPVRCSFFSGTSLEITLGTPSRIFHKITSVLFSREFFLLENIAGFLNSEQFLMEFFTENMQNFFQSASLYCAQSPLQDLYQNFSCVLLKDFFQDLSWNLCKSFPHDISQMLSQNFFWSSSRDLFLGKLFSQFLLNDFNYFSRCSSRDLSRDSTLVIPGIFNRKPQETYGTNSG